MFSFVISLMWYHTLCSFLGLVFFFPLTCFQNSSVFVYTHRLFILLPYMLFYHCYLFLWLLSCENNLNHHNFSKVYSPTDGHLDCFHILSIANSAAIEHSYARLSWNLCKNHIIIHENILSKLYSKVIVAIKISLYKNSHWTKYSATFGLDRFLHWFIVLLLFYIKFSYVYGSVQTHVPVIASISYYIYYYVL